VPVISPGIRGQTSLDDLVDFSGTITAGGTSQLVLPQQLRRLSLFIQNLHASAQLNVGMGPPRPVASISGGAVTSISVSSNAGLGYSVPPVVRILGGVFDGDYQTAPSQVATAYATLSSPGPTGTIASITVDHGGSGYQVAPLIYLENQINGPFGTLGGGAFNPTATTGIALPAGQSMNFNGAFLTPTSALVLYGPTTGQGFCLKVSGLV
jgi:hypothetical protein